MNFARKVQKKAGSSQFDKYLFEGLTNVLGLKRDHFIKCEARGTLLEITNISKYKYRIS